jgi:hypothetical protein
LTLMLGALGLLSTRPWETTALVPSVAVSPDLGAALGDSVAVVPAGAPSIAKARVATGAPAPGVGEPVAVSVPTEGESAPLLAVAPGRAVESVGPNSAPHAPSSPPAQPAPAAQQPVAAAPEPVPAVPVATAPPPLVASSGSARPGSSGVIPPVGPVEPAPSCAGDEYTITVSSESDETITEESELEILIQRTAGDGSESELLLEGDLGDVRSLVDLLVSEGNCVQVVFEPPGEGETLEPAAP